MQMALDKSTNDLIKADSGGIERVTDGRYIVQLVQSKLKTALGEWLLDPRIGWINIEDYEKGYDLFAIELRARKVILSVTGVKTIDTLSLEVSQRKLYLTFTATSIYGGIDLTIPWSG